MASLFQGSPQTATSYATSSTETPRWMQDAIYNQIQLAQNVANTPFQPYELPTVAELSPLQQQAYQNVAANQGTGQGTLGKAISGMEGFSSASTAGDLQNKQGVYLRPGSVDTNLSAGQGYWNRAGNIDAVAAAQPYLTQAAGKDIVGAAQPYIGQALQATGQSLGERAMSAANPYLQNSAQSAAQRVGEYMSPYQQGVLDLIARQGTRNLQENILPAVSDTFIKAGQFGSSRMGEFGARAARDTQQAILDAQAQAAQQGYGQALGAAQTDLARQAQLASTAGSISQADLARILQGGAQYGNLGQTMGQLTNEQAQMLANIGQTTGQLSAQQMSQLANLGQMQTQAGQAQQQFGLSAAQAEQAAQAQDYARQMSALNQMAQMAQQEQAMKTADVAALEAAGAAQQSQLQRELNAAQVQHQEEVNYPKQQLDWLNTQVRGLAPIVPQTSTQSSTSTGATYSPSPLSQLASGFSVYKGLQNLQ